MIVRKIDGVWRGTGRGEGKPDIEIVHGSRRWDIYEIHPDNRRVLVASDLTFSTARDWEAADTRPPNTSRDTRTHEGQHRFGPITAQKTEQGWRVFSGNVEYGAGLVFWQAKRLAAIEEAKHEMAQFKLPMSFVPYLTRNINLHRRLAPARWRALSKETYTKAGGICEGCGTAYPRLECHEEWGYDDYRGIQRLKRLRALCTLCHRAIHFNGWFRWPDEVIPKVRDHFLALNGVDEEAMSAHFRQAQWVDEKRADAAAWFVDFGEYTSLLSTHPILYKGQPALQPLPVHTGVETVFDKR